MFSSQPSQPVLPASVPPTVACWATPYCDSILVDFAHCYNISGTLKSPNGDDGRSEVYQRCLCNDRGTVYKDILTNYQAQNTDNVTQCYACMKQAGIEVDKNSEPSLQMRYKIHNFCNTAVPNLYDLLALFLVWLKSTDEPVENNTELGNIPSITTLADRFTKTDLGSEHGDISAGEYAYNWGHDTDAVFTATTEALAVYKLRRGEKGRPDYLVRVDKPQFDKSNGGMAIP
ncbi:uncharacterized protein J4E78_007698 [Alternaria triticimaculans]|uniref:uncharacterized protein n=1 Tax=Alternaria triticimaculans TaxID=297637 RepID=UPI0020C35EA4|nr:uncharacterized protein J4E78_007698 [Alternaria triticimaculans]KAI4652871.1 hypothetical protein J4E78_007698 [Alternaria triticimaculans]